MVESREESEGAIGSEGSRRTSTDARALRITRYSGALAAVAAGAGARVVAVAGRCTVPVQALQEHRIEAVYPLTDLEPDPTRSMRSAAALLETTAERIAADWLLDRDERTRTP
jgi:glycerate kinase